ncbi:class IV adenylate cyclase [bacterium]|nr:class IV adenylate cyclase [bacterium]
MATNIEWKAKARDFDRQQKLARQLTGNLAIVLQQRDTFFVVPEGRLKLRQLSENEGDLIFYRREDIAGAKASHFLAAKTRHPNEVRQIFADRLGVIGEVIKTRRLYLAGQSRLHFDSVEGLGHFIEVEVVLREGQSHEEGHAVARELQVKLGVATEDLIGVAYLDLLLQGNTRN